MNPNDFLFSHSFIGDIMSLMCNQLNKSEIFPHLYPDLKTSGEEYISLLSSAQTRLISIQRN